MNTGKELNLDGNKVINVANPRQAQDASTKDYVDRTVQNVVWQVHNYNPLSSRDEYIHFINDKEITMASLTGVCKVTTDWKLSAGVHAYTQNEMMHILLESATCSNTFWLPAQDLKTKYIAVEYKFPVAVHHWVFVFRYECYAWSTATFHWEVSNDGEQWHAVTASADARCTAKSWNGNTHSLYLPNNAFRKTYPFWRIVIDKGTIDKVSNNDPWVNLLLMKLYE